MSLNEIAKHAMARILRIAEPDTQRLGPAESALFLQRCCLIATRCSMELAVPFCDARYWILTSDGTYVRRSLKASSRRSSASLRIGRGVAKLKRSQVSPPGPNCSPGLAKMRARSLTLAATSWPASRCRRNRPTQDRLRRAASTVRLVPRARSGCRGYRDCR